jgi:hypothetical protein
VKPGPVAGGQLRRLHAIHRQGEHALVTGPTGSGKSTLGKELVENRARHGSYVMVFSTKLRPDETLDREFKDYTVWKKFKKKPKVYEDRVILRADTRKMSTRQALLHQRQVFGEALDELMHVGHWTFMVDEGFYFCHPQFLGLAQPLALHYAQGRTGKLTAITLAQRPANLPLIIYDNISHAFVGRVRDEEDRKRLANIGAGDKRLHESLKRQGLHDFTWFPIAPDWPGEPFNLAR